MSKEILTPEQLVVNAEHIVQQYPEIAGLQTYESIDSDAVAQKQNFLSGQELDLQYPDLDAAKFRALEQPMRHALETLMPADDDPKAKALFETVAYRYGELSMLSAAQRMNDASLSEADRAEARDWFVLTGEALHGKPEKPIFSAIAKAQISAQLERTDISPVGAALQQELAALVGPIDTTDYQPFKADQETVDRIHDLVVERFESIVDHIDPEATYNTEQMNQLIGEALDKVGGTAEGWQVEIDPKASNLSTSPHRKRLIVGGNRKDITGQDLRTRIMHEVGVHAGKAVNAERAGWTAAQYGLDDYLDFEEGLAKAMEDAYNGVFKSAGQPYYLIAGLAYGLDNHEPRAMREVHEVLWRARAIAADKAGQPLTDEKIQSIKDTAFGSCMRMFRGTDTKSPGVVYLKDLSYFRGQQLAWSVLKDVHTQADMDLLLSGKTDLTRPDHRAIAQQILAANKSS